MKRFLLMLCLGLVCLFSAAPVWAEDAPPAKMLSAEDQLEIGKLLRGWPPDGIAGYDPTKLEVSCPLPVYAYTDTGFVQVGQYLPLLYAGEPAYFILVDKHGYSVNFPLQSWWVQAGAKADRPLALVVDRDSCYYFDGADWLLLHKSIDVHLQNPDYAVLDVNQPVDTATLPLTELRAMQPLDRAFPELLPRVAPPADDDIAIYVDGVRQPMNGWLRKGRTLLPLRDICDLLGVQVDYADATQRITLRRGTQVYSLRLNDNEVLLNGRHYATLDVAAQEREGKTYLPLRFTAQLFALDLVWDEQARRVDVSRPDQPVNAVIWHVRATNEKWDMRLAEPYLPQQMYDELFAAGWDEADAPSAENLSWYPNLDNPDCYYQLTDYDFLRSDGSVYANCAVYLHVPGQPLPEEYTEYLLCWADKWYLVGDDFAALLDEWQNMKGWQRLD